MSETTTKPTSENLWLRLLYMILFIIVFGVAEFALYLTAAVTFLFKLRGKADTSRISGLGHSIALYIKEIADYLTFNTEVRPFPFSDWPSVAADEAKYER